MKKLLLTLALLISFGSYAQIGEIKSAKEKTLVGYNNNITKFHSLNYILTDDNEKLYTLNFRNMKYQQIDTYDSFSFKATDDELEYVYDFFIKQKEDKNGKSIELGDNTIFVKKMGKGISISNITIGVADNYFWLLPKDLERIFGKRK